MSDNSDKHRKKINSRQNTSVKWGGSPSDLPAHNLPSNSDIARYFYHIKCPQITDINDYRKLIQQQVIAKWTNCNPSLPLKEKSSIDTKLYKFLKKIQDRNTRKLPLSKQKTMDENKDHLFDIAACVCDLPVLECSNRKINCKDNDCRKTHIHCECAAENKIPANEREYIKDQRKTDGTRGHFQLAGLDCQDRGAMRSIQVPVAGRSTEARVSRRSSVSPVAQTSKSAPKKSHDVINAVIDPSDVILPDDCVPLETEPGIKSCKRKQFLMACSEDGDVEKDKELPNEQRLQERQKIKSSKSAFSIELESIGAKRKRKAVERNDGVDIDDVLGNDTGGEIQQNDENYDNNSDEEKCGCEFLEKMCWKHKEREAVKMSCNIAKKMVNLWANPFDPPGRPLETTRPPTFGEILQFRKSVEEQEGIKAGEVFGKVFEGVVASWKKFQPNLKFKKAIFAREQIKGFFKKVEETKSGKRTLDSMVRTLNQFTRVYNLSSCSCGLKHGSGYSSCHEFGEECESCCCQDNKISEDVCKELKDLLDPNGPPDLRPAKKAPQVQPKKKIPKVPDLNLISSIHQILPADRKRSAKIPSKFSDTIEDWRKQVIKKPKRTTKGTSKSYYIPVKKRRIQETEMVSCSNTIDEYNIKQECLDAADETVMKQECIEDDIVGDDPLEQDPIAVHHLMEIGKDKSIESELAIPSISSSGNNSNLEDFSTEDPAEEIGNAHLDISSLTVEEILKGPIFKSKRSYNKSNKILNNVPSIVQPVLNVGIKLKELCPKDPTTAEGPLSKISYNKSNKILNNVPSIVQPVLNISYNKSTKVLNNVPTIVQPVLNDGIKLKKLCPKDPTIAEGPLFKATSSLNITTIKGNIQAKGATAISIEKRPNSDGVTLEQSVKKSVASLDDTTECAKVPLYKAPIQDSKMISKAKPVTTAKLLIVVPDDPTPIQAEAMQILKDLKKKFVSSEAFCRLCKTTKGLHNYASLIQHYQSHAGYRYLVQKNGVIVNNSNGINTGNCSVGSTIKIGGGTYVAPKLFKCVLCSKYFETNEALNKHLYTLHSENKAFDRDLDSIKDNVKNAGDVGNKVDVIDEDYGNNALDFNNPVNVYQEVDTNNPVKVNNSSNDYIEDDKDEVIEFDQLLDEFASEEDLKDADEELISEIKVEESPLNF